MNNFFNLNQHVFIDIFSVLNQMDQTNIGFIIGNFSCQLGKLLNFINKIKLIFLRLYYHKSI